MSTPVRAVIYTRVSTSAQEQVGTSLDTQEERCRAYAAERGWQIVAVERETYSGADLFGRPRLSAVREMLRAGGADILLAYALDRLSRKQTHVAIIADEAELAGVELAFVTEDFERDRSAPSFVAPRHLPPSWNGRRSRSAPCAVVNSASAMAGRSQAGGPIYGYQWRMTPK